MSRTDTYRPFRIEYTIENGTSAVWDTYPSRAAANKAIKEDAVLFGLTDAQIIFRGSWSKYPTQDREIKGCSLTDAHNRLSHLRVYLSRRCEDGRMVLRPGRRRDTVLAMTAGLCKRIASLEA